MEIYNHQNLSKNSNYINDLIGKKKKLPPRQLLHFHYNNQYRLTFIMHIFKYGLGKG